MQSLAETYSILRTCLEIRKNEIRALEWDITLTSEAAAEYQGDKKAMRSFIERRKTAKKFFRRPDPNYYTFEAFVHAMMDQVFVVDAMSASINARRRARDSGAGCSARTWTACGCSTARPSARCWTCMARPLNRLLPAIPSTCTAFPAPT